MGVSVVTGTDPSRQDSFSRALSHPLSQPGKNPDPAEAVALPSDAGNLAPATEGTRRSSPQGGDDRAVAPRLQPLRALDLVRAPRGPAPALPRFEELDLDLDPRTRTLWCFMRPEGRPSFTTGLLADLAGMQRALKRLMTDAAPGPPPVRYYVLASRLPGIFNLGGNLHLFADRIRARDRACLEAYARACIDVLHTNAVSFEQPIVTIALVQGDALGGGFEAALSCDVIVAERGAKFGLPEVLFNLFPGMGAYSFLSRRLGAARAEAMILSGQLHSAEELHALGLVQVLAEPGQGRAAVEAYIARNGRRHNAHRAVYQAGRCVHPLRYEELERVIGVWVDAAMALTEADLRKMERLVAAQNRRQDGAVPVTK